MPGEYIEPSIALLCLSHLSNWAICALSKVGYNTYLMSSNDESINIKVLLAVLLAERKEYAKIICFYLPTIS